MTRNQVLSAIADGVDPSTLGRLAHRILDYVLVGKVYWVKTPSHDWHVATVRELRMIDRGRVPDRPKRAYKPRPVPARTRWMVRKDSGLEPLQKELDLT
jgi:hypothetical protein